VALKTVEFWGHTKHHVNETINQYFHRFHELLDDLLEAEEPISTRSAIRQFIFTLGPEFEQIQNNYRINNLPSDWATQDWPTILVLCRNYFNSVKPQGVILLNLRAFLLRNCLGICSILIVRLNRRKLETGSSIRLSFAEKLRRNRENFQTCVFFI